MHKEKRELKNLVTDFKNYLLGVGGKSPYVIAGKPEEMTKQSIKATQNSPYTQQTLDLSDSKLPGDLKELEKIVSTCKKCPLGETRLNAVFGVGSSNARIMFVGEGPGFDEDHRGEPFVGRAGKLLDKIILAMGFRRQDVYIANIVKCHAMVNPAEPEKRANDRPPATEEFSACLPYLERQISIIKPDFIVALGAVSARVLLGINASLGSLRGSFHNYPKQVGEKDIKIVVTYHPAALLRNPHWKVPCWEDLKMLLTEMGLPVPKVKIKNSSA